MATKKASGGKRGRGRPSKFSPEICEVILAALRRGAHIDIACTIGEIDIKTFYSWLKKGKQQESGEFRDFLQSIKKTLAEYELDVLSVIEAAPEWQSKAWILERRFPKRWAKSSVGMVTNAMPQSNEPPPLITERHPSESR